MEQEDINKNRISNHKIHLSLKLEEGLIWIFFISSVIFMIGIVMTYGYYIFWLEYLESTASLSCVSGSCSEITDTKNNNYFPLTSGTDTKDPVYKTR